jgi:hypothetical protein
MAEDNNQKVVFLEETSPIISEILQKYNLEETDEEILEKEIGENPSLLNGEIVLNIAIEIIKEKISTKDLPDLLQKRLNIPPKTAVELTKDLETKLLVFAKKITAREPETEEKTTPVVAPVKPIEIGIKMIEKEEKITDFVGKPKKNEKIPVSEPLKIVKEIKKNKGPDIYREPIE